MTGYYDELPCMHRGLPTNGVEPELECKDCGMEFLSDSSFTAGQHVSFDRDDVADRYADPVLEY